MAFVRSLYFRALPDVLGVKAELILDPFVEGYLSYANSVLNNDGIFRILEFFLHYLVFPIFHFVLITYLLYYKPE